MNADLKTQKDKQTYNIIGSAMTVHGKLGNGFLEAIYQSALEKEFIFNSIPFEREKRIDVFYRDELIGHYIADFVCYNVVIVELKSLSRMSSTEEAQIINYLKASNLKRGLLINFGTRSLQHKRFVLNL
jgi:GxxExxY protein